MIKNKVFATNNLLKIAFIACAVVVMFTNPAIGLFTGLLFALIFGNPYPNQSKRLSKKLLQYAVVGLGFGMNLYASLESGKEGMLFTVISVVSVMLIGWFLGKALKLSRGMRYLISAGTAICGGSAIAAVAPVTKSSDSEISVSLATIFILNAIALFIFPPIGRWLGMDQIQFGEWAAIAIHDTSSVVGAAVSYGEESLQVATTIKLTRALWIIPLVFVSSFVFKDKETKVSIPWFILFFVLAMLVNTFFDIPESISKVIDFVSKKALILTLFLIGSGLSVSVIKKVGVLPLALGVLLWVIIAVISCWVIMF